MRGGSDQVQVQNMRWFVVRDLEIHRTYAYMPRNCTVQAVGRRLSMLQQVSRRRPLLYRAKAPVMSRQAASLAQDVLTLCIVSMEFTVSHCGCQAGTLLLLLDVKPACRTATGVDLHLLNF